MTLPARLEDEPKTLIYADILGFAALTNKIQVRVQHTRDESTRFSRSWTTAIQEQINTFNRVLDQRVNDELSNGGIQAMLFSDCAFLVFDNSLHAAVVAVDLMRNFIMNGVPVRMGIGKGTFYNMEYLTKTDGRVLISKSRFMGTAVVHAHGAEQCDGKGMRIFVSESVEEDLPLIRKRIKTVPLEKSLNGVKWELDYLSEPGPIGKEQEIEAGDRELFKQVASMNLPDLTPEAQLHYSETLEALNRMRKANNRL